MDGSDTKGEWQVKGMVRDTQVMVKARVTVRMQVLGQDRSILRGQ